MGVCYGNVCEREWGKVYSHALAMPPAVDNYCLFLGARLAVWEGSFSSSCSSPQSKPNTANLSLRSGTFSAFLLSCNGRKPLLPTQFRI